MTKKTLLTLGVAMAIASAAVAATPKEKCQQKKLVALGKRELCLQRQRSKAIVGNASDSQKCVERFEKKIAHVDKVTAKSGSSCRWLENGDGTATDLDSGLQWELKTSDGSIHDVEARYRWCAPGNPMLFQICESPGGPPDGSAFTEFLGTLNNNSSPDGTSVTGCFAGKCDWRLPTVSELVGIFDRTVPGCSGRIDGPCTSIPGETNSPRFYGGYWTSTLVAGSTIHARAVDFFWTGPDAGGNKGDARYVRAVRGGS